MQKDVYVFDPSLIRFKKIVIKGLDTLKKFEYLIINNVHSYTCKKTKFDYLMSKILFYYYK